MDFEIVQPGGRDTNPSIVERVQGTVDEAIARLRSHNNTALILYVLPGRYRVDLNDPADSIRWAMRPSLIPPYR